MLTGDLDRLLAAEISARQTGSPAITSAGTWQPAPPGSAPGTYATPVAFRLGPDPLPIATALAGALRRADWVRVATVTGGYLTVTVTPDALGTLATRITAAGPACARSTALAGTAAPAPPAPDLAAAAAVPASAVLRAHAGPAAVILVARAPSASGMTVTVR